MVHEVGSLLDNLGVVGVDRVFEGLTLARDEADDAHGDLLLEAVQHLQDFSNSQRHCCGG